MRCRFVLFILKKKINFLFLYLDASGRDQNILGNESFLKSD